MFSSLKKKKKKKLEVRGKEKGEKRGRVREKTVRERGEEGRIITRINWGSYFCSDICFM